PEERPVELEGNDPAVEEGTPSKVLGRAPQDLLPVAQDGASSAQEAILRVGVRRVDPFRDDSSLREESNNAFSQASVGANVVVPHTRVAAGENDGPSQVTGGVQEARSAGGASDRWDAGLCRPDEVGRLGMDPYTVGDRAVGQDRRAYCWDSAPQDRLVGADVLRARDADIDPRREARTPRCLPHRSSPNGNGPPLPIRGGPHRLRRRRRWRVHGRTDGIP